ncbi:MAG: preQ(1) synthase [Bacteroidota bacterium]
MADTTDPEVADRLDAFHQQALDHTRASLEHMARYGIEPEGRVALFLPPEARQAEIHRMPYTHAARQRVTYQTEPGEFTALCPFSGLPDSGTVRVEYVPGSWLLELKSLKYYLMSWRHIGAAQEDITALLYEDLARHLDDPDRLVVTTDYTVRGGIHTVCTVDSREQTASESSATATSTSGPEAGGDGAAA